MAITMQINGNKIVFKNAKLIYKNFAGTKKQYNENGYRNFCIIVDDATVAGQLNTRGLHLRKLDEKYSNGSEAWTLRVRANYNSTHSPFVQTISNGKAEELDEKRIAELDNLVIEKATIEINLYEYNRMQHPGQFSAFLNRIRAWVAEDWFDDDDDDMPTQNYSPAPSKDQPQESFGSSLDFSNNYSDDIPF